MTHYEGDSLIYVYGLIPASELIPSVDRMDEHIFHLHKHGEIIAVFEYVDPLVFSQQTIEQHVSDPNWVKDRAVSHHNVLAMLHQQFTVIPLKLCTIFADYKSLEEMLCRHYDEMVALFSNLRGTDEWNLKIYYDKEKLKQHVMLNNNSILELTEEMNGLSPGKQFLMKKKMNAVIELEIENEMKRVCMETHEQLSSASLKETVKKVWGRNVTGIKEEMTWNSVYLMDRKSSDFLRLVKQLENDFIESGFIFKASGPWPVYHFAHIHSEKT